MIASLEGNTVVVRALLERGSENDNFGLSLKPDCQCQTRDIWQYSIAKCTTIRGSTVLIQPMHMVQIDCF